MRKFILRTREAQTAVWLLKWAELPLALPTLGKQAPKINSHSNADQVFKLIS